MGGRWWSLDPCWSSHGHVPCSDGPLPESSQSAGLLPVTALHPTGSLSGAGLLFCKYYGIRAVAYRYCIALLKRSCQLGLMNAPEHGCIGAAPMHEVGDYCPRT